MLENYAHARTVDTISPITIIVYMTMAYHVEDLDRLIYYALQCLQCAAMALKLEQKVSVKTIN